MKDFNLSHDDPRLTAYALGELEGEDLAAVETAVRRDPQLLALVNEIRATTAQLEAALAAEPDADSVAAAAAKSTMRHPEFDEYRRVKRGPIARLFQFPQIYFVAGGAFAACFAIVAMLHTPPPAPAAKPVPVKYVQVPITFEPTERRAETEQPLTVSVGRLAQASSTPSSATAPLTPVTPVDPRLAAATHETSRATEPATPPAANRAVAVDTPPAAAPTEPVRSLADEKPAKDASPEAGTAVAVTTLTPTPSPVAPPERGAERPRDALGRVPPPELHPATTPSNGVRITYANPAVALALQSRPEKAAAPSDVAVDSKSRNPATITPGETQITLGTGASDPRLALNPKPSAPAPAATPVDDPVVRFDTLTKTASGGRESGAAASKLGLASSTRVASGRKPLPPRGALFARGGTHGTTPDNDFLGVGDNPKSTFPIDVSSDSYDHVRRAIEAGKLPARDEVRIEELVNFFPYRYAPPRDEAPFAHAIEIAEAPWAPSHRLVRVALKGREPGVADRLSAIAKDVKIEVVFNAAKVSSYRLIGFENPRLNPDDFDRTDGVDVGAGHMITALYEVIPIGLEAARVADKAAADKLLYQSNVVVTSRLEMPDQEQKLINELVGVTVAYRKPDSLFGMVRHANFRVVDAEKRFDQASTDFRFAAAVAEYGMILRNSPHRGNSSLGDVLAWASAGAASNADDPRGLRNDFVSLVRRTQALMR